jgi:integrase
MQIEKALSQSLWDKLIEALTEVSEAQTGSQYRIALAAMLLMGDSGLRREEVARARREHLRPSAYADCLELEVLGKGHKRRRVPVSSRTLRALAVHWRDRQVDETARDQLHLLSPLMIPPHAAAQTKQAESRDGYTPGSLYRLIQTSINNLIQVMPCPFNDDEMQQLASTTAHAFRHTFGTLAVARDVPIDVVQAVLGHASVGTTSIYVQTKQKRVMEEAAKYFNAPSDSAEPNTSTTLNPTPSPQTT